MTTTTATAGPAMELLKAILHTKVDATGKGHLSMARPLVVRGLEIPVDAEFFLPPQSNGVRNPKQHAIVYAGEGGSVIFKDGILHRVVRPSQGSGSNRTANTGRPRQHFAPWLKYGG